MKFGKLKNSFHLIFFGKKKERKETNDQISNEETFAKNCNNEASSHVFVNLRFAI
jgi:hypothetical protein